MSEEFRPALARALELGQYRQVGGVGLAAAVLIGVVALANVLNTWAHWHTYQVVSDYVAGRTVTLDDALAADRFTSATGWGLLITSLAAAIVFLVWLSRARHNAEVLCNASHRKVRGWVIGSWICPVVNLWFPFMVVDDVYRASRPGNVPDLVDLRSVPGSRLLGAWWALYLAGLLTNRIATVSTRNDLTVDGFHSYAVISTISTALLIGAAVMIVMIMREISRWQTP